jgi:hypothetical protein
MMGFAFHSRPADLSSAIWILSDNAIYQHHHLSKQLSAYFLSNIRSPLRCTMNHPFNPNLKMRLLKFVLNADALTIGFEFRVLKHLIRFRLIHEINLPELAISS